MIMRIAGWTALALVLLTIPLVRKCMRERAAHQSAGGRVNANILYDIEDCTL
jgi:hypothetical protein